MKKTSLPHLSRTAFLSGTVPRSAALFRKWKNGIIVNVFENGSFDDMIELLIFYGRKTVIQTLKNAVPLRKTTMNLCCAIFNLKPQDFRCYREKRFRPF